MAILKSAASQPLLAPEVQSRYFLFFFRAMACDKCGLRVEMPLRAVAVRLRAFVDIVLYGFRERRVPAVC